MRRNESKSRRNFYIDTRSSQQQDKMKKLNFTGIEAVLILLDDGMPIKDIAKHPSAQEFFSYHLQVKKMLLKHIRKEGIQGQRRANLLNALTKEL